MATAALQTNATANGPGSSSADLSGPCTIACWGTLNGATLEVQVSFDSGSNWIPVPAWVIANVGVTNIDPKGTYRVRTPLRGAAAGTSVSTLVSYA